MNDYTLSKPALAALLAVSRPVVDRLVAQGMPVAATTGGGRQRFDPAQVARWLLMRSESSGGGPDAERERVRLLTAQADTAELRLAKERGELVCARAVASTWATTFTAVRDLLRTVPMGATDDVMAACEDGRPAVKEALQRAIDDALSRAARIEVVIKDHEAEEAA